MGSVILRVYANNTWTIMFVIDELAAFEYRLVIEMAAAALAAQRRSVRDLERMARKLDDLLGAQISTEFERSDLNFREAMGVASGNRYLLDAISSFNTQHASTTIETQQHIIEYQAIYQAISSSDIEFARAAVHQQLIKWHNRSKDLSQ